MTYCSLPDLLAHGWEVELIELTDHDDVNDIDGVMVQQAIGDATAKIDGYLRKAGMPCL